MSSPIATRASWGARYRDGWGNRSLGRLNKWLHHTVMTHLGPDATVAQERAEMRRIEKVGQDRFGGGISYTFIIFPSGRIYAGHSVGRVGSHTGGQNSTSAGICLAGNYQTRAMTPQQLGSLSWLLVYGVARGWWREARLSGGHRDVKATSCPGNAAYRQIGAANTGAVTLATSTVAVGRPLPATPTGSLPSSLTPKEPDVELTDPLSANPATGKPSTVGELIAIGGRYTYNNWVMLRSLTPQVTNLVGAVAAMAKGEAFDEAKLLAGVQQSAHLGVTSGTDQVLAKVADLLEHAEGQTAREVADLVLTELGAAITNRTT